MTKFIWLIIRAKFFFYKGILGQIYLLHSKFIMATGYQWKHWVDLTVRLMYMVDLILDVSVGNLGNNYF